jgi:YegS/Rv2252/BmrU family lipid kinase
MGTKRIKIIVNPSAASGRAAALTRALGPLGGFQLEWVPSRSAEHVAELVRRAQHEPLHALALAGGDGTVTHALAGLQGPNRVPLALLPVGSGNDFAASIGVPRSPREALALAALGAPAWVDIGRCGERGFCCVAGVGLDELALRIIYGSIFPRSKALNIYGALRALATYQPRRVNVSWEGGRFSGEVMFVAVTNTQSYGGGFRVTPDARIDDGALDLCIVPRMPRLRLLRQFPRILEGTHGALPEVILARSPNVRIESPDGPLPVPLDGELGLAQTPVELHCEPRALQVIRPLVARAPSAQELARVG